MWINVETTTTIVQKIINKVVIILHNIHLSLFPQEL